MTHDERREGRAGTAVVRPTTPSDGTAVAGIDHASSETPDGDAPRAPQPERCLGPRSIDAGPAVTWVPDAGGDAE